MTNGTIEVGSGTIGTRFLNTYWPNTEGLTGGTTKQAGKEQPVDDVE